MFHTGSMEFGLSFLRRAVELGLLASQREGVDDPDSLSEGLWGLEATGRTGRALLAAAIGIVNYSFARRTILQHLVEGALSEVFKRPCQLKLVSDVVHTAVRPHGDGILHQQGVQATRPTAATVPLAVAGAPRVASYAVVPEAASSAPWCCHGKVELGHHREDLLRLQHQVDQTSAQTLLVGGADVAELTADAQAREAVRALETLGIVRVAHALLPIICFRGNRNGLLKIVRT
jgi:hypothetical protein